MATESQRSLKLTLDTHLRIKGLAREDPVVALICNAATVENPDWKVAKREKIRGVQQWIRMFGWKGDQLVLPRGMYKNIFAGFERLGITTDTIDHMKYGNVSTIDAKTTVLHEFQSTVVDAVFRAGAPGGIIESPPGSGKTVMAIGFIVGSGSYPAVVYVDRINLIDQWKKAIEMVAPTNAPIDVVTVQSGFDNLTHPIGMYSTVVLDECHHIAARTYLGVMQTFPAAFRLGLSATPDKVGTLAVAKAVLGPMIVDVPSEHLIALGYIRRAHVQIVETQYEFMYFSSHHDEYGIFVRNNYAAMMKDLVRDKRRNWLIVNEATKASREGRATIVISRAKLHLKALEKMFPEEVKVSMLTGEETAREREEIVSTVDSGDVVLSTLADEALDIPRLDTMVLAYPASNLDAVKQQIGRIERVHPEKKSPKVIDIVDPRIGVLRFQAYKRRVQLYNAEGYAVV